MLHIEEELQRLQQLKDQVEFEFLTSSKYKDEREWFALGMFVALLKQCSSELPVYATKAQPPDADFITYDEHKKRFRPIEVVEVLAPNRQRTKEYIKAATSVAPKGKLVKPIDDPWSTFINALNDKFLKFYSDDCWLLVYHNISYSQITRYGFWHNTILANVRNWIDTEAVPFHKCPYERVYVTDPSEKALVSIFPSLSVLVPERMASA